MSRITGDFLRVVSILAVLAIHATGSAEWRFHQEHGYLSEAFLGIVLNQLCRFAVPLFVMLSGFSLAAREKQKGELGTLSFYRERLYRIGLPYLVWTVVLLLEHHELALVQPSLDLPFLEALGRDLKTIGHYLFWQGADYHFYFFAIILECYLVFPLLRRIRSLTLLAALFVLHLSASYPLYFVQDGLLLLGFPVPSSFVLLFVFYFYAGILFAKREQELRAWILSLGARWIFLLFGLALALVLGEYVYLSYRTPSPVYYDHFQRISVMLYSLAVWALFVRYDARIEGALSALPERQKLTRAAGLSFAVFVFHTRILRGLERTALAAHFLLLLPCLWLASFALVGISDRLVRGPGVLRRALGLP